MAPSFPSTQTQETRGNVRAQQCLDDAIESSRIPRKQLADAAEIGESQLSKLLHHPAIDLLDTLPDEIITDFCERYGRARGIFDVRRILDVDVIDAIATAADRLNVLLRLRDVRMKPARATLASGVHEEARRHA